MFGKKSQVKPDSNTDSPEKTVVHVPDGGEPKPEDGFTFDDDTANQSFTKYLSSHIKYELLERIGSGGMGDVFKSQLQTTLGNSEIVALKMLRSEVCKRVSGAEETKYITAFFEKELAILCELNRHPNIVGFRGADYIQSKPGGRKKIFFVMEFIDGFDLSGLRNMHGLNREHIIDHNSFEIPNEFIGFILFRVANALDYAHNFTFSDGRQGIVHLDLSPGNILINKELGLIKLADFGVAASVDGFSKGETRNIVGKPSYISPEMVSGGTISFKTDFYSLGIVIYELLTGINPNRLVDEKRDQIAAIRKMHESTLIPPHKIARGVDEKLSNIVMKLMDVNPDNRFQSSASLREDVGHCIYDGGFGPTDNSFAYYLAKTQLLKYHFSEGKRVSDEIVRDYIHIVNKSRKRLQLYPDAHKVYSKGGNPCRK